MRLGIGCRYPRNFTAGAMSVLVVVASGCRTSAPSGPGGGKPTVFIATTISQVAQGDTIVFALSFADVSPGEALILRLAFDGGQPATDTLQIPAPDSASTTPGTYGLALIVPASLPDGILKVTASLPSDGDSSSAQVTIRDNVFPKLVPTVFSPPTPAAFSVFGAGPVELIAGAADSIAYAVSDNHELAWAGWALGPPANLRDSVAITGTSARVDIPITVPSSLLGTAPVLSTFVRDADDNLETFTFGAASIAQYVNHPVATAPRNGTIRDLVYDAKRNALYLLDPSQSSISVLSLGTMSYQPSMVLPALPVDLDITPGGDSLVVSLANSADIAFINLAAPTHPVSAFHLTALDAAPGDTAPVVNFAAGLRVASNGKAIIADEGAMNGFVELDLVTGENHVIPGSYSGGLFAKRGDATKLVIPFSNGQLWIYDATTDSMTGPIAPAQGGGRDFAQPVTVSGTGAVFTIGTDLYNSSSFLASLRVTGGAYGSPVGVTVSYAGTSAFSGVYAFCSTGIEVPVACPTTSPAYLFRSTVPANANAPIAQLAEISDTPEVIQQMLMLPRDNGIVGIGPTRIMSIGLTHSAPGFASEQRGRRSPPATASRSTTRTPHQVHSNASHRLGVELRFGRAHKTSQLLVTSR